MLKNILIATTLFVTGNANALIAGDIAFTAFNADEDGFAVVSFVDLAPNTTIYFNDNEWRGSNFGNGESAQTWNTGSSGIVAGTVVRFAEIDQASRYATFGSFTSSGNSGLHATAETLYAFVGTNGSTPTTFLAAISNGNFTNSNNTLNGTGLTVGVNAIAIPNSSDFYQYNGPRTGLASVAAYKPLVANVANWTGHTGGANPDMSEVMPNTAPLVPVPEPESYAMLLAGLGLLSYVSRRRQIK